MSWRPVLWLAVLVLSPTVIGCASRTLDASGAERWSFWSRSLGREADVRIVTPDKHQRGRVMAIAVGGAEAFDTARSALTTNPPPDTPPLILIGVDAAALGQDTTSKPALDFIEWELIPRLESRLRHGGRRMIIGEGPGADIAVAFALMRSETMDAHIAIGPLSAPTLPAGRPRDSKRARTALEPFLITSSSGDDPDMHEELTAAFRELFPPPPQAFASTDETR